LNSAATLFCLDVWAPLSKKQIDDATMVKVARRASVAIALFSFMVAPLLQFAPEGLWQIIRIFTGFYNIPVIAIVIIGLFTRRVPSLGPKVVVAFHIIAYGLFQFVLDDLVSIHFLHLYAILFFIEIGIMLLIGQLAPRQESWTYHRRELVDLTPWRFAVPCAATLISSIIALYLLFSPVGLVGGLSDAWYIYMGAILVVNVIVWLGYLRRPVYPDSVTDAA
ncbi:MAG: solute:sodium symporter family transporter, partial [Gammaproteobacteria bacterium]